MDNPRVKEWRNKTAEWLKDHADVAGLEGKQVVACYTFYMKDKTRRDIDNMISSVNDALVQAGILSDDNWKVLRIGSAEAYLDKENPRAEIQLIEDEWSIE